ncbi:MAG: hypothetical protein QMD95_01100 [Candidatus Hodarchaeaceae archaeon]|nr:hypothetical protein [Candidatus Hodarchaeaceae archaeon]
MRVRSSDKRSIRKEWNLAGRRRVHIRWAFRLFIVSFIALFTLSLFFYPSYMTMRLGAGGRLVPYVYSAFGPIPTNIAMYILFIVLGIWIAGWALLWGERKTSRPRPVVLGSWMVPLSITYAWVSLAVSLVTGVPRQLMTAIAFAPPLLVAVVAPQLFVRGLLDRRGVKLSNAALGVGFLLVGMWGASSFSDIELMMPVVEILLPVYLGLLVIEYLGVHLRVNGSRF